MSFVGKVNQVGDAYIRPHDLDSCVGRTAARRWSIASPTSASRCGSSSTLRERAFAVQLTRQQADELELDDRDRVFVRPRKERRFAEAEPEAASA